MRKLLAVTAVLATIAALYGCGGSSHQTEPAPQPVVENEFSSRPTATNVAAFWNRRKSRAPRVEVLALNGRYWVNKPATNILTTTAKGVRLNRSPEVEIYRLRVLYANQAGTIRWDGKGLLPLVKRVTLVGGIKHKEPLVKIKAYLYNPRVGSAVPIPFYCNGCDNEPRSDDPPRSRPFSG